MTVFTLVAAIVVMPVVLVILYVIWLGLPALSWAFLTIGTAIACMPLAIAAALYLAEYAKDNRLTRLIRLAIVNLASIPSIVYGLFGLGAFVLFLGFGTSILSVPQQFRTASLSLGLNLGIKERRITALIGPSGCGKSTFLRCLNRMNDTIRGTRAQGTVLLDGNDIYAPAVDVAELRQHVGMVFQRPNPFPQNIYDNVAFGPRVLSLTKSRAQMDTIVQESLAGAALWDEVKHRLNDPALALNPGQQQRLCIARTIAVKPSVILMDEPCSALDPVATLSVEELMRRLSKEYTIVIVTHNMQQAARFGLYRLFFGWGS